MATKRKSYGPVTKNSPIKRKGNPTSKSGIFGKWQKSTMRGKRIRSVKQ